MIRRETRRLTSLHDLYLNEPREIYGAEMQPAKAMPILIEASSRSELRDSFTRYHDETRQHIARLQKIFEVSGVKARGRQCPSMAGLITEATESIGMDATNTATDAALIETAQKIDHYQIAAYGTLRTGATLMEHRGQLNLLAQTLGEEKRIVAGLTHLAESMVNLDANLEPECTDPSNSGRVFPQPPTM